MKQLIIFVSLALVSSHIIAQQQRAFTMPAIFGQLVYSNGVYKPITLTGGNAILENDIVIDPAAKTITSLGKEDYRFVAQRPYQITPPRLQAEEFRFCINNFIIC